MVRRIRFRGSRIEKRYLREDLLVDDCVLAQRIDRIEQCSEKLEGFPRTGFHWEADTLVLSQDRIRKQPLPEDRAQLLEPLQRLGQLFEALSPGLVHGDVARKNLVFDGSTLWLVDWEPALYQLRNRRPTLLYTEPYLSIGDRQAGRLSMETDKLGFFFCCFRLLHGRNPLSSIRELALRRQQEPVPITPVPEEKLVRFTWSQILDLVSSLPNWSLEESA